jgi:Fe-Mn family superoxide dismutase
MSYSLPPLPYAYDALEPHFDALTMEIHHGKHHQTYVNNLNNAVSEAGLGAAPVEALIEQLENVPESWRTAVRNNGGGHANHSLFWTILSAKGGRPSGEVARAIDSELGGFDAFKDAFTKAAQTRFGSGWAWLTVGQDGKLLVESSANQDSPLMGEFAGLSGGTPILTLDVWEHAYYLNYQNRRPDYIAAFFHIINWEEIGVVVLFVQIGALCSENPLHDKHLRFPHFRALRIFRADWCASSQAPYEAAPCGFPRSAGSDLVASVAKLQLELPALEGRHHAAEFVPGDLATIDDDHRHSVVLVGIAVDGAAQDQAIVHLRPVVGVLKMRESQGPAHLANELAQQLQRVVVRLADHLKPIPGRAAIAQLERVDRHTGPEQSGAKPELVLDATPVDHAHGLEDHVLKPMQTEAAGGGLVEASAAKLPVAALRRPVVHDIVAERGLTAGVAGDWLHG